MRAKLRRITIDGTVYRWSVTHVHRPASAPGERRDPACEERLVVYLDGHKASPLRITFRDGPDRHAGYPSSGVVWTKDHELDLNRPANIASIVRKALVRGFCPGSARTPFVVADGFVFVDLGGAAAQSD